MAGCVHTRPIFNSESHCCRVARHVRELFKTLWQWLRGLLRTGVGYMSNNRVQLDYRLLGWQWVTRVIAGVREPRRFSRKPEEKYENCVRVYISVSSHETSCNGDSSWKIYSFGWKQKKNSTEKMCFDPFRQLISGLCALEQHFSYLPFFLWKTLLGK